MNIHPGILRINVAGVVPQLHAGIASNTPIKQTVAANLIARMTQPESGGQDWCGPRSFDDSPDAESIAKADPLFLTMLQFLERYFVPDVVSKLRNSGRWHYQAMLKHVISPTEVDRLFHLEHTKETMGNQQGWPYLDAIPVADIDSGMIRKLLDFSIAHGHSIQTATHIRSVLRSVFAHALSLSTHAGENPASKVLLPDMTRREVHSLTLDQLKAILRIMSYPEREAALLTMLTGMSMCEVCGLRWKDINLLQVRRYVDGLWIPPKGIAVRHQVYRCEFHPVPQHRVRLVGVPEILFPVLVKLKESQVHTDGNDFVLASRNGRPVNLCNLAARRLKVIGQAFEIPWLNWQVFRRTVVLLNRQAGKNWRNELKFIAQI